MGNEKMDIFAKAYLFLAKAGCGNLGVGVVARVVPSNKDKTETSG